MDQAEIKHVVEAALLAAGRPLTLDRLTELFTAKGDGPDRAAVKEALEALAADYQGRGIELKEVASGYRVQVRRSMTDWLQPLWEERAPRYTRALLETLALIAYRQPVTRGEIEEVRGVVVSTNITRTLLERNWIRVVGHRDVPGKPAMFGTTREFLDYFGLKRLEDLPPLAEIKDGLPELSPQTDLIDSLEAEARMMEIGADAELDVGEAATVPQGASLGEAAAPESEETLAEPAAPAEASEPPVEGAAEASESRAEYLAEASEQSVEDSLESSADEAASAQEPDVEAAVESDAAVREVLESDTASDGEQDSAADDEADDERDNVVPLRAAGRRDAGE